MRRGLSLGFVASGVCVLACNGILGIEDLHEEPRPNSGGTSGSGGATSSGSGGTADGVGGSAGRGGSTSGAGGGSATGGKSTAGSGGTTTGEGGAGPGDAGAGDTAGTGGTVSSGGSSGTGGKAATGGAATTGGTTTGDGGVAGEAGAGGSGPTDTTVHGKLIDAWGRPVPNAPVFVGDTSVQTDANGQFSYPDAPAQYEVVVKVTPGIGGGMGSYMWVYQGLTRRDPTLQVYAGLQYHEVNAHITVSNGMFGGSNLTSLAFGSPDTGVEMGVSSAEVTVLGGIWWRGSTTTAGRIHTLRWTEGTASGVPVGFQAYYETALTATAPTAAQIPITFPATAVTTATVAGTVTSPTSVSRKHFGLVHFTSNATIKVIDDWNATNAFSYTVPTIANSVITLLATEGDDGPFALAHKGVAAGTTNVTLAIPTPPSLALPADGATNVGVTTQFRWTSSSAVTVFHAEAKNYFNGVYIVTAAKQVTLPVIAHGNMLAGELYYWDVETHGGTATSVDQASGSSGFLDSCARTTPVGTSRAAGTYANSEYRAFTPVAQ